MSWRYRYRREHLADDLLVDGCNELGEEGWSLVGAPRWDRERGQWACFFKRTISNREQAYERMHRETTPEERAAIAAAVASWQRGDRSDTTSLERFAAEHGLPAPDGSAGR